MKTKLWAALVCLVAVSCGGESSSDGNRGTGTVNEDDVEDAGRGADDDEGESDDDYVEVEDDDVFEVADDDLFVPVEDDDVFEPVEDDDTEDDDVPADDDIADDDIVVDDDVADDDIVVVDDDMPADDDVMVMPDDDMMPADDDMMMTDDDMMPADDDMMPADDDMMTDDDVTDGCMIVGQGFGPTYCNISERCGNTYKYSNCNDNGMGVWSCSCSNNYVYQSYQLTGVDQDTACTTVMEVCDAGITPEFMGEPVCSPSYQSAGTNNCSSQEICTLEADLGNGITAVQQTSKTLNCSDNENYYSIPNPGDIYCYCSTSAAYFNYILSGSTIADACEVSESLCTNEGVPFTGEPMCEITYDYATTTYCNLQQQCGETVEVAEGVTAALNQPEYADCQFNDGVGNCGCSNSSRSMRFEMSDTSATACHDAATICRSTEEIVSEGPVECSLASQSSSTTSCNASVQCSQAAEVEGVSIGVYGYVSANCSQNGDVYSCQCRTSQSSASIEVEAEDAWDACTIASDECQEAVDVVFDGQGVIYY